MSTQPVRKFNPGLNQTDDEIIRQFVVRENLLNHAVDTTGQNSSAASSQHILFYGPRGRGKTMLMTRFEIAVRKKPEFHDKWTVVRLFEEAYYEIDTAGELWLAVLDELGQTPGINLAGSITKSCEELRRETGKIFEQKVVAVLNDILDRLPNRLILIVENLQDLTEEISEDDAWSIRKLLQNQPKLMLVATATSYFSELGAEKHAFFELFDTQEVKPLSRHEAARLWNFLTSDTRTETEVRPLQILTGGSPRLLAMMAQFAVQLSMRELMEELSGLVDDRTDYFKSQIESLPKAERRVFVAMADLWDYSTAKQIADSARMEVATVSSLLNRLEKRGALNVDNTQPRKKRYAVTERLTCVYYKMRRRRGEAEVAWHIINFARTYYTPAERQTIEVQYVGDYIINPALSKFNDTTQQKHTNLRSYAERVAEEFKFDEPDLAVKKLQQQLKFYTTDGSISGLESSEENHDDATEKDLKVAMAMGDRAFTLGTNGDTDGAIAGYEQLIEKFGASDAAAVQELVAMAMGDRAFTLGTNGDTDGEIAGYEQLIEKFGASDAAAVQKQVALAMGSRAVTLGTNGGTDGEIAGYEQLIEKFGASDAAAVQEQVAMAMFSRAVTLGTNGDPDGAIAGYEQLIEKFGASDAAAVQKQVAMAMFSGAVTLGTNGDTDGAIAGYEQLIEKFGASDATAVQEQVAKAMRNRAITLGTNGDTDGAIAGYEQLIKMFGDQSEQQKHVHVAIVNKQLTLVISGRAVDDGDSIQTSRESIAGQLCYMITRLSHWASSNGNEEASSARLLARKVIEQPDHESERLELSLGIAALMDPGEALNILKESGVEDSLKPIVVYLQRQSNSDKREVFELSEIADDVAQRVGNLRKELFQS